MSFQFFLSFLDFVYVLENQVEHSKKLDQISENPCIKTVNSSRCFKNWNALTATTSTEFIILDAKFTLAKIENITSQTESFFIFPVLAGVASVIPVVYQSSYLWKNQKFGFELVLFSVANFVEVRGAKYFKNPSE